MAIYKIENKNIIAKLFYSWQETIIWSCLQNCMGDAYADNPYKPLSAKIFLGDFCFLAGAANCEIALYNPPSRKMDFIIAVPQDEQWGKAIECVFEKKAFRRIRYATKKDTFFSQNKLQNIISRLPVNCQLKPIDRQLYEQSFKFCWSKDLCVNFANYEEYAKNGFGFAILKNGEFVSGASSYSYYRGGIEIEIDTREDERRKGFAAICGAKLILECLAKNLYPSWDAQNKASLLLAEKLGYVFDKEYPVYEITDFGC